MKRERLVFRAITFALILILIVLRTGRGSPVNGLCYDQDSNGERHSDSPLLADDQQPFTTMGFMNGAGSLLKVRRTLHGLPSPLLC